MEGPTAYRKVEGSNKGLPGSGRVAEGSKGDKKAACGPTINTVTGCVGQGALRMPVGAGGGHGR